MAFWDGICSMLVPAVQLWYYPLRSACAAHCTPTPALARNASAAITLRLRLPALHVFTASRCQQLVRQIIRGQ
jgi:hypothetical protein